MATKTTVEPVDITPEDSVVPVYLVPLTDEEIAEREQAEADRLAKIAEEEAAAEAKLVAQATAKAKLAKLGLTDDEVNALIG